MNKLGFLLATAALAGIAMYESMYLCAALLVICAVISELLPE